MRYLLGLFFVVTACGTAARGTVDAAPQPGDECTSSSTTCVGQTWMTCQGGVWVVAETCSGVCSSSLGCVVCEPNTGTCDGDISHACRPDGSGFWDEYCDPALGLSCGASGVCEGACSAAALGESNVGCLYYPTIMANWVNSGFDFALALANTSNAEINVTIDGGALSELRYIQVAPNSVFIDRLPWVVPLKACISVSEAPCGLPEEPYFSQVVPAGAYRVRSDGPLAVYQYSPLDFQKNELFSYTNDASLLLPAHVWGTSSLVASWHEWEFSPGLMTVTAREPNTQVTITTRSNTQGQIVWPEGSTNQLTLNEGDVVQLMTHNGDFTGSLVTSDKPVQVLGGHYCTEVPGGPTACDHLEESMIPTRALGTEYLASAQLGPTTGAPRVQYVRVIAADANTTVTTDPPVIAPTTLAATGDFLEFGTTEDVFIRADRKVLVANYMTSQNVDPVDDADPSMAVAAPVAQGRTQFLFHAPTNYTSNFVNVIAPAGTGVTLDGNPLAPATFTAVGVSGYTVAKVPLANSGDGNHRIEATQPVGILVYGYAPFTSYMYPGGTEARTIVIQ